MSADSKVVVLAALGFLGLAAIGVAVAWNSQQQRDRARMAASTRARSRYKIARAMRRQPQQPQQENLHGNHDGNHDDTRPGLTTRSRRSLPSPALIRRRSKRNRASAAAAEEEAPPGWEQELQQQGEQDIIGYEESAVAAVCGGGGGGGGDGEEGEDFSGIEIVPNSGGGDCLFHCFKDALGAAGNRTSIRALRRVVAEAVTDDQFQTLKAIYDSANTENEYQVLVDYPFMKGVKDIQGLRSAMMRRSYWGDEMALAALEKRTKLKAIVFTTQYGKMQIANTIDGDLQEPPKSGRYIMVLLHNLHYQLIKYNGKVYFKKRELPPEVLEIIGTLSSPSSSPEEEEGVTDAPAPEA